jgi:hypothetical protein
VHEFPFGICRCEIRAALRDRYIALIFRYLRRSGATATAAAITSKPSAPRIIFDVMTSPLHCL